MTKQTTQEKLFETLDTFAIELLDRVKGGALEVSEGDDNLSREASVNEQVRVFTAVSGYAMKRLEHGPKPDGKEASDFDRLRSQFAGSANGDRPPPLRGARRTKAPQTEAPDGFDA